MDDELCKQLSRAKTLIHVMQLLNLEKLLQRFYQFGIVDLASMKMLKEVDLKRLRINGRCRMKILNAIAAINHGQKAPINRTIGSTNVKPVGKEQNKQIRFIEKPFKFKEMDDVLLCQHVKLNQVRQQLVQAQRQSRLIETLFDNIMQFCDHGRQMVTTSCCHTSGQSATIGLRAKHLAAVLSRINTKIRNRKLPPPMTAIDDVLRADSIESGTGMHQNLMKPIPTQSGHPDRSPVIVVRKMESKNDHPRCDNKCVHPAGEKSDAMNPRTLMPAQKFTQNSLYVHHIIDSRRAFPSPIRPFNCSPPEPEFVSTAYRHFYKFSTPPVCVPGALLTPFDHRPQAYCCSHFGY